MKKRLAHLFHNNNKCKCLFLSLKAVHMYNVVSFMQGYVIALIWNLQTGKIHEMFPSVLVAFKGNYKRC